MAKIHVYIYARLVYSKALKWHRNGLKSKLEMIIMSSIKYEVKRALVNEKAIE